MSKLRVLIVDDERTIADSLRAIFEKRGFEAKAAYGPDEGLDCAHYFQPELLLCDLTMPGMGGLAMAARIARALPACRVLVLTGDYLALEDAWNRGRTLFQRYIVLTKPIHPEMLLQEANQLLHARH